MEKRKSDFKKISQIYDRAANLDIAKQSKISFSITMGIAKEVFDISLVQLLDANDSDFSHDIIGIQDNINTNVDLLAQGNMDFSKHKLFFGDFQPRFGLIDMYDDYKNKMNIVSENNVYDEEEEEEEEME